MVLQFVHRCKHLFILNMGLRLDIFEFGAFRLGLFHGGRHLSIGDAVIWGITDLL
jgi:hypothetical protein